MCFYSNVHLLIVSVLKMVLLYEDENGGVMWSISPLEFPNLRVIILICDVEIGERY